MNTRTYARTTRDAFKGLDYSCAVERPPRKYPKALWIAMVLGILVALIAARAT